MQPAAFASFWNNNMSQIISSQVDFFTEEATQSALALISFKAILIA